MKRKANMTEALDFGAVMIVECDRCGAIQDALSKECAVRVEAGELYAGEVVCWRCKAKDKEQP